MRGRHDEATANTKAVVHFGAVASAASWDILVVNPSGGPETRHLADDRTLVALDFGGFLVDTVRGPAQHLRRHTGLLPSRLGSGTVDKRAAERGLVLANGEPFLGTLVTTVTA